MILGYFLLLFITLQISGRDRGTLVPAVRCLFWRLVLAITSVLHRRVCSHVRRASMSCRQQLGGTVAGERSRCNLQICNLLEIGSITI